MLPEKDGFTVLKELREQGITTPVLIITAKKTPKPQALGGAAGEGEDGALRWEQEALRRRGAFNAVEVGADDYLTKPFYLEELKMRIQALLKRSGKFDQNTFSFGDVCVNLSTNSTYVGDKEVELLGKEFDLLVYFLQNQNVILPKSQIFDRL